MISNRSRWFQPSKKYLRLLRPMKACLQINFLSPNSFSRLLLISFFFILLIMIDHNVFQLVLVVSVVKKFYSVLKGLLNFVSKLIFVSKSIFSTYTHVFISILHIVVENDEFQLLMAVLIVKNFFLLFQTCLQIIFVSKSIFLFTIFLSSSSFPWESYFQIACLSLQHLLTFSLVSERYRNSYPV